MKTEVLVAGLMMKLDQANFAEYKKLFPAGHECKPGPGKVIAVCFNSVRSWKMP